MKSSGNVFNRLVTTGNDAIEYHDTLYDDIVQPVMGKSLDSTVGKIDPDFANSAIKFADSCDIAVDSNKVYFGYQIGHKFKLDGTINFHLHWIQEQADTPNWWAKWRLWQNGKVVGSWTEMAFAGNAFTYTSGTMLQISYFPEIDLSAVAVGGTLGVSDFFDVQFTRDADNDSGLFAGDDPVSGSVSVKGIDPHLEVDQPGSKDQYVK